MCGGYFYLLFFVIVFCSVYLERHVLKYSLKREVIYGSYNLVPFILSISIGPQTYLIAQNTTTIKVHDEVSPQAQVHIIRNTKGR